MYVTPRQKRKNTIRIILLVIGLPFTVLAAYMVTRLVSNAGQDTEPVEVVKSNITSSSITVTWVTGRKTSGSILIDQDGKDITFPDLRGSASSKTHYVEVTDLDASTEYSFKILSGGDEYGSSEGSSLKFKTLPISTDIPVPNPVFGNTVESSLVFIVAKDAVDSTVISTISGDTGSWYLDLSTFRKSDGSPLDELNADDDLSVIVQTGDGSGYVDGTFTSLFDEDGLLIEDIETSADIYAIDYIPSGATLIGLSEIVDNTDNNIDNTDDNTDTTDDNDTTDENVDDVIDAPTDNTNQPYQITSDVTWEDLVSVGTVSTTPDVATGEESLELISLTDTGATLVWVTSTAVEGSVDYGVDPTSLSDTAVDNRDSLVDQGSYNAHIVELQNLLPNTKYYYSVSSGSSTYDDDGDPYEFTTFETLDTPPPYKTATGNVSGLDNTDVIVVAYVQNNDGEGSEGISQKAATIVDQNSNWNISLGDLRTQDGAEYFSLSDGDNVVVSALTYAESDVITTTGDKLEDESVQLIASPTTTTTTSEKVVVLSATEYRVYEGGVPYGIGSGGDDLVYDPDAAPDSETPDTGLFDNNWTLLGIAGSLITAGLAWTFLQGGKGRVKKEKSSMRSML